MDTSDTAIQRDKRKIRTVFLCDPVEREKLDKLSADSGAPLGELLRRSVSTFLSQQGDKPTSVSA